MRFACRLCLALGIDDPEDWLDKVSPRTFALWQAYYQIEPWGKEHERDAMQSMQLHNIAANIAASYGVKVDALSLQDFMPGTWVPPGQHGSGKKQSTAQIQAFIASRFRGPEG